MSRKIRIGEFADHSEVEFEVPEDLTVLEDENLSELEARAVEAYDALRNESPLSDEAISALSDLAAAISDIRGEAGRRYEAAAASEARAAEFDGLVHPETPEVETTDETPAETEAAGAETTEEVVEAAEAITEAAADEKEPALVAAATRRGATRVNMASLQRRAPAPDVSAQPASITAASDIPGVAAGSTMNLDSAVDAMSARAARMGDSAGKMTEVPVMRFNTVVDGPVLGLKSSLDQVAAAINIATQPKSLVASGGWCAPSTPIFNLFSIEDTDGLVDLPTLNIDRGGVKVPVSPAIGSVVGDTWTWTEANDIASSPGGTPTKPCFHVPCTTWNDFRLDAYGICVTNGNLQDRAFPEMTKRFLSLVVAQNAHVQSAMKLGKMAAGSTAVTMPVNTAVANTESGALAPVLNAIELQAIDYRAKFKMGMTASLEVVLPHWLLGVFRADLGYRFGADADDFAVADALLSTYFSARNVVPQFVLDWQITGAYNAAGGAIQTTGIGNTAANAVAYPAVVNFMLYAAGTWVQGTGGTLDLGVIRDSVLNATNDFTAAWSEEFWLLFKQGHESRNVQVTINPTGGTAQTAAIIAI